MHDDHFKFDDKESQGSKFGYELAMRGYAAFSISYRVTGDHDGMTGHEAMIDAQEDYRAAIRFLRSKADQYRLDTNRIIASGYSFGADTALHIGFAPRMDIHNEEGNSGNPGHDSDPNGVIAIAGQFYTGNYDTILNADDYPPVIFIHTTAGYEAPYDDAKVFYDLVKSVGVPATMLTLEGEDQLAFPYNPYRNSGNLLTT